MNDGGDSIGRRRFRRRWRVLAGLLLMFAVAIVALWTQRRPLAEDFVDRELARRGVPARYEVAEIGLRRQVLRNLVVGDPANPDLIADRVEIATAVGFGGAEVTGIRAGRVRMRARLSDGRVSLGALDRLMGPPTGAPFALPKLDTRVADLRIRLETPYGAIGLKASGAGRLDDGFTGRLAAAAPRLAFGDCAVAGLGAATALRIVGGRPSLEGPLRARRIACAEVTGQALAADVAVTFGTAMDRWTGRTRLAAGSVAGMGAAATQLIGRMTFDGTAAATAGDVRLTAARLDHPEVAARAVTVAGRYRAGTGGAQFAGETLVGGAALAAGTRRRLSALDAPGTPLGPVARAIGGAAARAAGELSGSAAVEAVVRGGAAALRVTRLDARSASGARLDVGGTPLRFGNIEIGGSVRLAGGGLPDARVDLARGAAGLSGRAVVAPYAAGGARLELTPVRFRGLGGDATAMTTTATVTGPLGDGRIDALRMPVDARWRGGAVAINPGCTPLAWQRLTIAGLSLRPATLRLCATGPALVTLGRSIDGGARIDAPRLVGTLGGSPLTLAATGSEIRLRDRGFVLSGVAARLGAPGRVTRIDAATLDGRIAADGSVGGRFDGLAGQIANVPLLLSGGAGNWTLRNGTLTLGGRLQVADAQTEAPRFVPMASEDVALRLENGVVQATGTLIQPQKRARIANVRITHSLSRGAGGADLVVPGITFGDALQPNEVTPLTFGVIADVKGRVAGRGQISWTPEGVASSGTFGTEGMDFAAAFGPVTGLKGRVVFTDLLGLVSAPDQVATVASVNPGIAVENGTVRYRLVGDSRIQVAGARWPFAGGELTLDPTLLDFGRPTERRMTFRVVRADAAAFLQQFDFDNINATGTFDGVLPMIFDESGGRIVDGRLESRGGGSLAYVGALSDKQLGTWGNLAFQALKSLRYREVEITLDGPLAGEMLTAIRFSGVSQGEGAKSNFIVRRLARLPFVFNITIRAPFRQLLDSVQSYYDPSRLIQRNLPALLEERRRRAQPIQPPESEKRP